MNSFTKTAYCYNRFLAEWFRALFTLIRGIRYTVSKMSGYVWTGPKIDVIWVPSRVYVTELIIKKSTKINRNSCVEGDVTRADFVLILAQHSITTLLRHYFEWLQHCSNICTLCCAQNRRYESSPLPSP